MDEKYPGLIHGEPLTEEMWQKIRDLYRGRFVVLSSNALELPAYSDPTLTAFHEPKEDSNVNKPSTGQD